VKKIVLFLAVVLVAVVAVLWVRSPQQSNSEAMLMDYLKENHATPQQQEAYLFALQHPEVLHVIPCYCGCARQGHKSNFNCFIKSSSQPNEVVTFDSHGLFCPMCVDIAIRAKDLLAQHKSLKEIRAEVDGMFKNHPNLMPTPTPKPA
jgi:hypothetical protein